MPRGLVNESSTCYVNAALQLLFKYEYAGKPSDDELVAELLKLQQSSQEVASVKQFLKLLYDEFADFRPYQQGDASEMITRMLERACDVTNRSKGRYGAQKDEGNLQDFLRNATLAFEQGMDSAFERQIRIKELSTTRCACGYESRTLNFSTAIDLNIENNSEKEEDEQEDALITFILLVPFSEVVNLTFSLEELSRDIVLYNIHKALLQYYGNFAIDYPIFSFFDLEFDCTGLDAIIEKVREYNEICAEPETLDEEVEEQETATAEVKPEQERNQENSSENDEEPNFSLKDDNESISKDTPSTQQQNLQLFNESEELDPINEKLREAFEVQPEKIRKCIEANEKNFDCEHLILVTVSQAFLDEKVKFVQQMIDVFIDQYEVISLSIPFPAKKDAENLVKSKPETFRNLIIKEVLPQCEIFFSQSVRKILESKSFEKEFEFKYSDGKLYLSHTELKIEFAKKENDIDIMYILKNGQKWDIQEMSNLLDCISDYEAEQKVDGWKCEQCERDNLGKKQTAFIESNRYLLFNLKRFRITYSITGNQSVEKEDQPIVFQDEITFCDKKYQLGGFTSHYGIFERGHYVACVTDKHKWFLCNDAEVTQIDAEELEDYKMYAQSILYIEQ